MTPAQLSASARAETNPPTGLSREARALWFTKRGDWEAAHALAQDIETPLGSWIHALLHLIEGDLGNARYWFVAAGRPVRKPAQIDELWAEIAAEVLK
jgi:hypothetical protein